MPACSRGRQLRLQLKQKQQKENEPNVLLLEQLMVLRDDEVSELELKAGLDPKTGKFKVLSKKKVPIDSEAEK